PVTQVSGEEADEYNAFLQEYNQYWRTFFDPIALRLQITPQRYRLETVVLPLIDNSIYTGLARMLGGKPEALDMLPVPKRNIFSFGVRFDKKELVRQAESGGALVLPEGELEKLKVDEFLFNGVGSQVGLHVYDAVPLFDFSLPSFLGLLLGNFSGRQASFR